MLLCSIADVRERTASNLTDDALGALIESASDLMEEFAGAWLAPRPSDPAATTTLLFDVESTASSLRLSLGGLQVGIRTLTSIGLASTSQPETAGSYTTVTGALLRPRPSLVAPATRIVLASGWFWRGFNTVTATGSFGPATVAPRTREVAIQLVTLNMSQVPGVISRSVGDWSATYAPETAAERDAILSWLPRVYAV